MAYVTVGEVRCEGVPKTIADEKITGSVNLWQQFIERACRQWFESRALTVNSDGNDGDILFLPVPIIALTSLYINDNFTTALAVDGYKVYNGRAEPNDDRRNPRIKLVGVPTLFDPPVYPLRRVFAKGKQNQRLVGTFGFTEADGSTPLMIRRALLKLVVRDLQAQGSGGLWQSVQGGGPPVGPAMFEMTDGHSIQYGSAQKNINRAGLSGITGDNEVDAILALYRAPISIAAPSSSLYYQG